MFPTVFYIPQNVHQEQHRQIQTMQYMPGVFYQSMVYPHPSTFYQMQLPHFNAQPLSNANETMYNSAFQFERSLPILQNPQTPIGSESQFQGTTLQRPPSQATSVKADMGSTSASVVNRVSKED
jgi:hypothetical protein